MGYLEEFEYESVDEKWSSEDDFTEVEMETGKVETMVKDKFKEMNAEDVDELVKALTDGLDYIMTEKTEGEAAARETPAPSTGGVPMRDAAESRPPGGPVHYFLLRN